MKVVTAEQLPARLQHLPEVPRIIASGNFAAPLQLLSVLDAALPEYRLHMLNAQTGIPDRDGVISHCEGLDEVPLSADDLAALDKLNTKVVANAAMQVPVSLEWYAKWEQKAAEMYQEMLTE